MPAKLGQEMMEEFFENPPNIYTFNYDNLFETKLKYALMHIHDLDESDADAKLKKLNVRHLYGSLNITPSATSAKILDSLERIYTIGRSDEKIQSMSDQLSTSCLKSKRIFLLGFGFDELNCKTFLDALNLTNATIFATAVGLAESKRQWIKANFPGIKIKEMDCFKLIRDTEKLFR